MEKEIHLTTSPGILEVYSGPTFAEGEFSLYLCLDFISFIMENMKKGANEEMKHEGW